MVVLQQRVPAGSLGGKTSGADAPLFLFGRDPLPGSLGNVCVTTLANEQSNAQVPNRPFIQGLWIPADPEDELLRWINIPGSGIRNMGGIRPLGFVDLTLLPVKAYIILVTVDR